jgi:hypothetical protein
VRRSLTHAALSAIVLLAAVPCSAATSASSDSPEKARHRNCVSSQLTVRVARWLLGTTHTGGYIAFTNRSQTPCRLTGWPELAGVTTAGTTTVARHVRSTWYGPHVKGVPVLTLRHGRTAQAAFSGSDLPRGGAATCSPAFRHLRVTAPGNTRSVLLSAWFPPLGRFLPGCAPLEVSMVVPRSAFGP